VPEILSDRRTHLPICWQGRAGARISVRLVVAVLCIEALAGCARRPVEPLSAAVSAPIRSTSNPLPRRTPRASQSGTDCQFTTRGLGDTWIDADGLSTSCGSGQSAAPRSK
jgi:curli biogenesis system outer membrane secretion channel CsgG